MFGFDLNRYVVSYFENIPSSQSSADALTVAHVGVKKKKKYTWWNLMSQTRETWWEETCFCLCWTVGIRCVICANIKPLSRGCGGDASSVSTDRCSSSCAHWQALVLSVLFIVVVVGFLSDAALTRSARVGGAGICERCTNVSCFWRRLRSRTSPPEKHIKK